MKKRIGMIVAGGLVLASGWLWFSDRTQAELDVPVRTKATFLQRSGGEDRPMQDAVVQDDAVVETTAISLSSEDHRTRAEAARAVVSPSSREEMTRRVVQEWAAEDAEAAMAWAGGLQDADAARMAMQQVCARVADEDPAAAIRLAMDHGLDQEPGDFIGGLACAWAGRDLSSAREWVESQPQGELRDGLMGAIVFELAKTDPSTAARMVAEQMGDGDARIEAAISVVHQWASRDPRAATSWVESFPESDLKERARREIPPEKQEDR